MGVARTAPGGGLIFTVWLVSLHLLVGRCLADGRVPDFKPRQDRQDSGDQETLADKLMNQLFGKDHHHQHHHQSFPESTCQTEYTDILGGNINEGSQAKSPKQCQKKCQDTLGCNFFSWDRFTGHCWLKRGDGLRFPHPMMIIGPKFCPNMNTNPHIPVPKEPCTLIATQEPCDFSSPYQTFSGQCNNVANPIWGAAHTPFVRLVPPQYGPESSPRGPGLDLPAVRTVTAAFPESDNPDNRIASMMMQFGQFLDHDISNTFFPEKRCCVSPNRPECFNIIVPSSDSTYQSRHNASSTCIDFTRSSAACGLPVREQVNMVTSFLDASQVYGSDINVANRIRSFVGGRLLENDHKPGHLPTKLQLKRPSNFIDDRMEFIAGDLRVNEQMFLTCMHVLFLREHNRLASMLQEELETDNDELLYQSARKLLIVEFQAIVYKEFLPLLLGDRFMNIYKLDVNTESVYNPNTNPTAINEFAAAAMRFGHSMINSLFKVITHEEMFLRLRDIFNAKMFNGNHMLEIDPMILGLLNQNAQKVDGSFADEVTNHLFDEHSPRAPKKFGGDLVARNIQRARDHGLPGYNHYRKLCNLQPINSFNQRPKEINTDMWNRFKSLYKTVEDIDLFPAGMAEEPSDGAMLGATFSCILGLQFHNLKYGDRFFFSHHSSNLNYLAKYMKEMESRKLSDIICDNTDILEVQVRAMESPDSAINPVVRCVRREERGGEGEEDEGNSGTSSDSDSNTETNTETVADNKNSNNEQQQQLGQLLQQQLQNLPAAIITVPNSGRPELLPPTTNNINKNNEGDAKIGVLSERVPKSLGGGAAVTVSPLLVDDFFASSDQLAAPAAPSRRPPQPPPRRRQPNNNGIIIPPLAPQQQQPTFFDAIGRHPSKSLLFESAAGGGGSGAPPAASKPVRFVEIFRERDAIAIDP